jgi:hypothetical protein
VTEAALSKKMVAVLRQRGAWAVKTHGDARQRRGLPDILACYRGVFLGLEVKLPSNSNGLTKLQAATLNHIDKADGVGTCVRSVAEVRKVLDDIDQELV